MGAIFRLAWKEFSLPFFHLRSNVPGGRDFVFLSLMLVLVLTLALLLFGTREGLLNRFVDIFLGSTKDHGVPVWVIPNPFARGGINLIDHTLMKAVEAEGHRIHPYREIEGGFDAVDLPEKNIWRRRSDLEPGFSGWAVNPEDPLWRTKDTTEALPLRVILDRHLFRVHFSLETYRNALRGRVPAAAVEEVGLDFASGDPFQRIWLEIKAGQRTSLLPFEVTWLDHIPAISKIAFLFPMPTYHALREAANYPQLKYFPEFMGGAGKRIVRVATGRSETDQDVKKFAVAMGGELQSIRGRRTVSFKTPQPEFLVNAFALEAALKYRVLQNVTGNAIGNAGSHLLLPCKVIPKRELFAIKGSLKPKESCTIRKDVTSQGNGFIRALVYVKDRTQITGAVERLEQINDRALSIHPIYQDALNRSGFLTEMLESLRLPYGSILFFFLLAVLGIQISTLVGHRRVRYAIFMAKGIAWHQIYAMLYLQMTFAVSLALVGAAALILSAQKVVSVIVEGVAREYSDKVNIVDMNLLPIGLPDYVAATTATLILALAFTTIIVYMSPIRRRTQLGALLQT
jgi:hypothetical protein